MPTDRFTNITLGTNLTGTDNADGSITIDASSGGGGGSSLPRVKATRAGVQSIGTGAWTVITWDAETIDTDAFHDNSTNNSRLTIPTGLGGDYLLVAIGAFAANATGFRGLQVNLNTTTANTSVLGYGGHEGFTGLLNMIRIIELVELSAGDWIVCQAYQNSGGNLDFNHASLTVASFSLIKVG